MFTYNITDELKKKLTILCQKDKVLAQNFYKKVQEITSRDLEGLNAYKNLKSPLNEYKRIHLTGNYILIFSVSAKDKHIVFVEIMHRDKVYGK
ncbi:MAG: type II toxin-antitoxin system RelE family toxin [Candidatus Nanoarchaeia archaeon]